MSSTRIAELADQRRGEVKAAPPAAEAVDEGSDAEGYFQSEDAARPGSDSDD